MQENATIFAQIRLESDQFFNQYISPVPGYSFNMYEMIKLCHLYRNSKFEDSSSYLGRDKLFFNVVNPACEVATKMLNVDTKNIRLWPMNPRSTFSTYLLEKEIREWLKTSEFGEILNQIAEELPIYGSVFLEKTPKGASVVDIRRIICDQSAECIDDSRFITTIHYMTPAELRETGWDNVEEVIAMFGNKQAPKPFEDNRGDVNMQLSTPFIKVHKRYGEVPKKWLKGTSDEMVKSLFIVAGVEERVMNDKNQAIGEKGVVLFKSEWKKEWPFRDFYYTKSKGRLLGIGVIEMLLDTQVRINELKNQKRISMEISTIHLFQTKDKQIVRNVLTDLENGDVMLSPNGIEPVANEERNLSAFQDEEQSYLAQADKLTFAYQAIRGETPPSSTPLGTTQIVTAQSSSVFGFKRENFALALRDFFNEFVMPQALKDLDAEHIMRFAGSAAELLKIDQAASEVLANDYIKQQVLSGQILTKEGVELFKEKKLKELKREGQNRFLKIKKGLYKDIEYEFDFIIDNEQADPQVLVQNFQKVISDLASNPMILQDPRLKLLYYKYAEKLGISQAELEMADSEAQDLQAKQEQNGQTGGGNPQGGASVGGNTLAGPAKQTATAGQGQGMG